MHKHSGFLSDRSQQLLKTLGENIDLARKRRRLQVDTICKRAGITGQTYQRLKKGEKGVSIGVLMNVLSALDMEEMISSVAGPSLDHIGLAHERSLQPVRVHEGDANGNLDPDW
ncbi:MULTISPECIES: helix-turn-helix transcriptional regulator [unclassified Pseudomonas]|uniref:helix-turn-helix domain-containing protein n=1 Tax=unclassified Pseudomonas TaxID=196821 RepID=UPI002AC8DDDA|nr:MULTISPECIES: helix-turn-helix transcriptional regulator [unclassified Pseudomonas]MEB0041878.1 helix-turn-helix transcriptional regulator [Pseudomonas sp. MH10]MEB0079480.1 helix-turn-helix transcriptional regulator [Pseudomonas sp. MH10out]MEB0093309.1 helix-turn-helix transcriptional regulator [Pseudomonas sp. CCI4.2]MEB0102495.1 helix-turn-helix transcriptional regulator [Pseudomonas sp. CCI3.2]MEB0122395.1 helix-turn-helix transcriptional regulator [Pseudomonas sp. CCI1.2]